jgi:acid phosphatase
VRRPFVLLISVLVVLPALGRTRAVHHPSPPITHVFVVVLENTDAADAERQPFLARLIREGTYLRNYHGVAHPSQPNYIALVSGSTHGVSGDEPVTLNAQHLGDLLDRRGLPWKTYAEDYAGACDLDATDGLYARKHVPFLSFANVTNDHGRCSQHVVNANELWADVATGSLPSFALYVPNQDNDGHETGVAYADRWLENTFGPLLDDPRFTEGTLFIVTFDEDASDTNNRVATVLWGTRVRRGAVSSTRYDHYALLRTIEEIFGTGTLGLKDETAQVIGEVLVGP